MNDVNIFSQLEDDIKLGSSSRRSVIYKGMAVSFVDAGFLCICCPDKKEHAQDLEAMLARLFQYQWDSWTQYAGIQIALNEARCVCFLWPVCPSSSNLHQMIHEFSNVCASIFNDAGMA